MARAGSGRTASVQPDIKDRRTGCLLAQIIKIGIFFTILPDLEARPDALASTGPVDMG